jgi:hypothetical protein
VIRERIVSAALAAGWDLVESPDGLVEITRGGQWMQVDPDPVSISAGVRLATRFGWEGRDAVPVDILLPAVLALIAADVDHSGGDALT